MKTSHKLSAAVAAGALLFSLSACAPAEKPAQDEYPGGTYDGDKTNCLVTGKEAIARVDEDGRNSTDYRIFTKNCGTFAVQDDPFIGQWNSADTYGSITEGESYDFEAYGWRNGFLSTFPNIKKAYLLEAGDV